MFNYNKEPIIVSPTPFNKEELIVIDPSNVIACGVDSNNKVFVIAHGMPNGRYYPIHNNIDYLMALIKCRYWNYDERINYEEVKRIFADKMDMRIM